MATGTATRMMRAGLHAITAVLVVIGAVSALQADRPILALSAAAAFVVWYIAGAVLARRRRSHRLAVVWLIVLAVIWAAASAFAPEFIWLAFPLWLLAGQMMATVPAAVFSAVVLAVVITAPIARTGHVDTAYIVGPVVGGLFAYGISRGYLRLLADARERQRLVSSLLQAQDDMARLHDELGATQRESGILQERTRLSRDIHDTIAQSLSAIVLLARAQPEDPTLERIATVAETGLVDVRRIVAALAPAQLQEGTLVVSLRRMLDRLAEDTGILTSLDADDHLPQLPVEVDVALLRTAQSALSNVRLHSGASRVVVHLADVGDGIRLDIVDDGRGFDLQKWVGGDGGYGLRAMRDRLRELGGGLDIEAAVDAGTALSAHVPLAPARRAEEDE
ncbi:sensor histidine kinase [Microbacterium horticulturae]|uniref:Sensor histidine kinase n=1 Tax=Microbacterium horticulturae TaxID=3028316 RepID=A0ABY8BZE0_9MICO|nr:sensor histidine kinase [Microbacterium sp. KACC 23027]WEG09576.1 sensor histidine kinase [Microbacterium sp. KACC 23027]